MQNNETKQIASAIIIAGVVIAGAILLKDIAPQRNTQDGNTANSRKLNPSTAKTIGLNVKDFNACLASGKFKNKIQADIDDGVKIGVNGTPASFIMKDGVVVDRIAGAQPIEKVNTQIAQALAGGKKIPVDIRPVTEADHILGNPNAKIIIVEYSDLECPFCKQFHNTMHQIISNNPDVAWVYRHYPIPQLHPKAFHEAEATECAWEQGGNDAFWKYTDTIYKITPSNNGLDEKEL
jgi:protein-disulfide isomerase